MGSEKHVGGSPVLRTYHSYNADNKLSAQGWQIGSDTFAQTYTYGEWDGSLSTMTFSQSGETLFSMTYGYDSLRRLSTASNGLLTRTYSYTPNGSQTTAQVSSLAYTGPASSFTYGYTYDNMGNIETYTDGNGTLTYTYDDLGQLTQAVHGDTTYAYTYDNAGNILTANGHTYTYGDTNGWADLLTAVDSQEITYDAIGNPTSYYNGTRWAFTWTQGRQLEEAFTTSDTEDLTVTYAYDADGLRTSKTVTTESYHVHNYLGTLIEPTCTESGYIRYQCACGDSYQDAETAATGHSYIGTDEGTYIQYTCSNCGDSYTEDTSGHVHEYVEVARLDATCTEAGCVAYECACGSYQEEVLPALGHDFLTSSLIAIIKCKRCGYIYSGGSGLIRPFDAENEIATVADDTVDTDNRVLESTVVTEYEYIYAGTTLVRMVVTTTVDEETPTVQTLDFGYDASGMPVTVTTGGATYYYITNLQGDVMALVDSTGTTVAEYSYDPYGGVIDATGDLAEINPLTYRGYVYDTESTLYYLQSRYYDPEIGRFINADSYASTGQGILGNNMFAYCGNNPICFSDPYGFSRKYIPLRHDGDFKYITDQDDDPWGDMTFGSSTIGDAGCGLVATYNAMITLGDPRLFSEIYEFFENYPSGLMDHGKNGIFIGYVVAYFLSEGYSVNVHFNFENIEYYSRYSDACIMLYQYEYYDNSAGKTRIGGHYFEYSWRDNQYTAHNDRHPVDYFLSPVEYGLSGDSFFIIVITVSKNTSGK